MNYIQQTLKSLDTIDINLDDNEITNNVTLSDNKNGSLHDSDSTFFHDEFEKKIIYESVGIDVNNRRDNVQTLTFSGDDAENKLRIISLEMSQNNKVKFENFNKIFKYISRIFNAKSDTLVDTVYKDIIEYHGSVTYVDKTGSKFRANLVNVLDDNDVIILELLAEELQYESDKNLLKIGAKIVWIIGQEEQLIMNEHGINGPRTNISKCIVRRTRDKLSIKQEEEARKNAEEWVRYFRRFKTL